MTAQQDADRPLSSEAGAPAQQGDPSPAAAVGEKQAASFPFVVAIDGPAASGKSTLGALLAERLGYLYFDTGAMYRAVTWAALACQVAIDDEEAVTALAEQVHIDVMAATVADGRQYTVLVDKKDVTWQIRQPEVDRNVSAVSAYAGVRAALTAQQRRIAARGRMVMVGRDIGTVVLPDAPLKIYLDASSEERARRRWLECQVQGGQHSLDAVLADMERRDRIDSARKVAPLRVAPDAAILDSTDLTVAEVLDQAVALATGD